MAVIDTPHLADPHPGLGVWRPRGLVPARSRSGVVIETDGDGAPVFVDDLDADRLLELAAESEAQAWAAERRKLRYAHQWCVLNPPPDDDSVATWSTADPSAGDCDVALGGDGTPHVAEGAAA